MIFKNIIIMVAFLMNAISVIGAETTSVNVAGQQKCPFYKCIWTKQAPKIDGNLSEDVWRDAASMPILKNSARVGGNITSIEKSDISGTWKALWNDTTLYVAVDVTDNVIQPFDNRVPHYVNDSIELFFDMAHDYRTGLQYSIHPFGKGLNSNATIFRAIPKADVTKEGVNIASKRTKKGYSVEIEFPLKHFFDTTYIYPSYKQEIGFDVSICDMDVVPFNQQWKRKVVNWSGDGSNWRDPSKNGTMFLVKSPEEKVKFIPQDENLIFENKFCNSVWPSNCYLQGDFVLQIQNQSFSNKEYKPWHLGELRNRCLNAKDLKRHFSRDRKYGPYSGGPVCDIKDNRINLTVRGDSDNEKLFLRRTKTPYHPAIQFRTNEKNFTLFAGMLAKGQPSGPSYAGLPLKKGFAFKLHKNNGGILYDRKRDGELKSGWALVGFVREEDNRDTDIPVMVMFSRCPERIAIKGEKGEGGLQISFNSQKLSAITILSLYGIRGVERSTVTKWLQKGFDKILQERINFWYHSSLCLPIELEQKVQFDEKEKVFYVNNQFEYTDNISQWNENPSYLAPVSPLMGRALMKFNKVTSTGKITELDYPTQVGPYFCVKDTTYYKFQLKIPKLNSFESEAYNLEKAKNKQLVDKYLKEIGKHDFKENITQSCERAFSNKYFAPHSWPPAADHGGVGYVEQLWSLDTETRNDLFNKIKNVYHKRIFNPDWRERFFPEKAPYLGSPLRVTELTTPYGPPEPMWNIVRVLAGLADFSYVANDYSIYVQHWDEIKRISSILWNFGHGSYRYDGGLMNLDSLIGLLQGARAAKDRKFEIEALYRLTQLCYTIPAFFQTPVFARKNRLWSRGGYSAVKDWPIHARCLGMEFVPASQLLDGQFCYDRSYGNPEILRQYALEEITYIENKMLPECKISWLKKDYHSEKMRDGALRRFRCRARIIRDKISDLEKYLQALKLPQRYHNSACSSILIRLEQDKRLSPLNK